LRTDYHRSKYFSLRVYKYTTVTMAKEMPQLTKKPIAEDSGMPWWIWLLIALAIIAFIIIVVTTIIRSMRWSIMLALGEVVASLLDGLSALFFFNQIFGR
jgi:hypothetical protein